MNQQQRNAIADRIAAIASRHGAQIIEWRDDTGCSSLYLSFLWPGKINVSMDIDDLHKGGILSHWYNAQRDLADPVVFDSVNEYHRRKATLYGDRPALFYLLFEHACKAVADGSAFLEPTE